MGRVLERDRPVESPASRALLDLAALQRRFAADIGEAMEESQVRPGGSEEWMEILRRCQSLQSDVSRIVRLLVLSQMTQGRG